VFVDMCMHSIFIRIYIMECKYSIFKHSVFIRMYIPHLYTYVYTFYICTRMCIHSIFIHIWYTHICILICVFIHIYVYLYVCLYTYMYTYMCVYTHICIHSIFIHIYGIFIHIYIPHLYAYIYLHTSCTSEFVTYGFTWVYATIQLYICIWISIHLHTAYTSEFYLHLNMYTPPHCIRLRILSASKYLYTYTLHTPQNSLHTHAHTYNPLVVCSCERIFKKIEGVWCL